jgi:hypothetical protein
MIRTSIAAVLLCAAATQAMAQGNGFEPVTKEKDLWNPR